jgi:hypothetical protein
MRHLFGLGPTQDATMANMTTALLVANSISTPVSLYQS